MKHLFDNIPEKHWPTTLELANIASRLRGHACKTNDEAIILAAELWVAAYWYLVKAREARHAQAT